MQPSQSGQNWDITYCISADTISELNQVSQATTTCRETSLAGGSSVGSTISNFIVGDVTGRQNCACYYQEKMCFTPFSSCRLDLYSVCAGSAGLRSPHPPAHADIPFIIDPNLIGQDPQGRYYTCFTGTNLDRNLGKIETAFRNTSGQTLCTTSVEEVSPGNYGWFELWDNTLETRFGFGIGDDPSEREPGNLKCSTVTGKGVDTPGINTAFGCVATDVKGFTKDFLTLSLSIGGTIGLLLILYGFFLIATSGGNPTKIQLGQQIITGVIQGLTVIALSVVLLNFLGINLLNLPGLR